jgi:hypothetical protein
MSMPKQARRRWVRQRARARAPRCVAGLLSPPAPISTPSRALRLRRGCVPNAHHPAFSPCATSAFRWSRQRWMRRKARRRAPRCAARVPSRAARAATPSRALRLRRGCVTAASPCSRFASAGAAQVHESSALGARACAGREGAEESPEVRGARVHHRHVRSRHRVASSRHRLFAFFASLTLTCACASRLRRSRQLRRRSSTPCDASATIQSPEQRCARNGPLPMPFRFHFHADASDHRAPPWERSSPRPLRSIQPTLPSFPSQQRFNSLPRHSSLPLPYVIQSMRALFHHFHSPELLAPRSSLCA